MNKRDADIYIKGAIAHDQTKPTKKSFYNRIIEKSTFKISIFVYNNVIKIEN